MRFYLIRAMHTKIIIALLIYLIEQYIHTWVCFARKWPMRPILHLDN